MYGLLVSYLTQLETTHTYLKISLSLYMYGHCVYYKVNIWCAVYHRESSLITVKQSYGLLPGFIFQSGSD